MLIPMLVALIYTSALIFGPVFAIVLALCAALLVRFSSRKSWIGVAMMIIGIIELSLVPDWVFWVFFIGLSTLIVGTIMFAIALFRERERGRIGLVVAAVGIIGIPFFGFVFGFGIWSFVLGLVMFVFGIAGAAVLLSEQGRAKIGLVLAAVGFVVILISLYINSPALANLVGLEVMLSGISVGVSGLPYWTQRHSGGNTVRSLRKILYGLLVFVIFSSALVFSLRATHVLREELLLDWSYKTTADTTVRGVVTGIYLNHEVNTYGISYHIFPALIIVNVTEVVQVGKTWEGTRTLTEGELPENMTVAYDKPDVPSVTVGQRVEASGVFDMPAEDEWPYSWKLVIATEIDGSYVRSLQG
jgi:hypothetical protein